MTKSRPQVTCTENFENFGLVLFETCEWTQKQTDRQTYRQVDCNTDGKVTKCADMLLEWQQALELAVFLGTKCGVQFYETAETML